MIKVCNDSGVYTPVLLCDVCHNLIETLSSGVTLVGSNENEPNDLLDFLHVHKGQCQYMAIEQLEQQNLKGGWQELDEHFFYLMVNTKVKFSHWVEKKQSL